PSPHLDIVGEIVIPVPHVEAGRRIGADLDGKAGESLRSAATGLVISGHRKRSWKAGLIGSLITNLKRSITRIDWIWCGLPRHERSPISNVKFGFSFDRAKFYNRIAAKAT